MPLDRYSQLTLPELPFYQALLRAFAERAGPPEPPWLAATASALGLDGATALTCFVELDLLVLDPVSGALTSIYPFSATPTRHLVRLAGGGQVYALCAIDALGIPFMLGQDVDIESEDPMTHAPIRVKVQQGRVSWQPETAVVLTVAPEQLEQLEPIKGVIAERCCPVMNFFAGPDTAAAYRQIHCEVPGLLLTQEEAVERGRRAFGDRLTCNAAG